MNRESLPRRAFNTALEKLTEDLLGVAGQVEKMLHQSVSALRSRDLDLARSVVETDDIIDAQSLKLEVDVETLIARHQPVASDLRRLITTLRISRDLERIGDLAVNISRITLDLGTEPLLKPLIDIPRMAVIAQEMVRDSLTSMLEEDPELARDVWYRDEEIDALYVQILRELLSFMIEDPRTIRRAFPLVFAARHLERVGDHATNISEAVIYLLTGKRMTKLSQQDGDWTDPEE